jgi:hypothetical protein
VTQYHFDPATEASRCSRSPAITSPASSACRGSKTICQPAFPEDDADAVIPLTPDFDLPDTVADQRAWLRDAGLEPELVWSEAI